VFMYVFMLQPECWVCLCSHYSVSADCAHVYFTARVLSVLAHINVTALCLCLCYNLGRVHVNLMLHWVVLMFVSAGSCVVGKMSFCFSFFSDVLSGGMWDNLKEMA